MKTDRPIELTRRQRQVLVLKGRGMTAEEVASRLGLTRPTVQSHLKLAFLTLGARNSVQAVDLARRLGLLGGSR